MVLIEKDQTKEISIEELKAKKLVLFFYPKASTPGWTHEAKDFSGLKNEFLALGYTVIGVSKDSVAAQLKFIQKYGLEVALISDTSKELINHFNVGSKIMVERTTIITDENLTEVKRYEKVKVDNHAFDVLSHLK